MEPVAGVYEILHKDSQKAYVGSSQDIGRRWQNHRSALRHSHHDNVYLQRAWDKYGEDAFVFSVLEHCSVDELLDKEQQWLDLKRSNGQMFNLALYAGAPMRGRKHTDEAKRRLSIANRGRIMSAEARQRLSRAKMGRKHTAETKRKLSKALLGRTVPEETKRKISVALTGRHLSEEHSRNISAALMGRRLSEEHRRKCGRGRRGKHISEEQKRKISERQVQPYPALIHRESRKIIPAGVSLKKLCQTHGLVPSCMSRVTRGLRLHHKGWMLYVNRDKESVSYAKHYPALIHRKTGEIIPAGVNVARLCRERGLGSANLWRVIHGVYPHHKGWQLLPD